MRKPTGLQEDGLCGKKIEVREKRKIILLLIVLFFLLHILIMANTYKNPNPQPNPNIKP